VPHPNRAPTVPRAWPNRVPTGVPQSCPTRAQPCPNRRASWTWLRPGRIFVAGAHPLCDLGLRRCVARRPRCCGSGQPLQHGQLPSVGCIGSWRKGSYCPPHWILSRLDEALCPPSGFCNPGACLLAPLMLRPAPETIITSAINTPNGNSFQHN